MNEKVRAQLPNSRAIRRDIQGLRGIAVIAVVLYHAFPETFPAGFVGVDMFLVIAGFVILKSLRSHVQDGHLRLREFVIKRALRLLPALATMVTITLLLAHLLLSPLGTVQLVSVTAVGAVFGGSNVVLGIYGGNYFSPDSRLNPLLHTWSLSLEEQLYVSVMLLVLISLALARAKKINSETSLLIGLFTLGSVSGFLAFSQSYQDVSPDSLLFGFYSPVTRFWEFALGGVAFMVSSWLSALRLRRNSWKSIQFAGLLLIGLSLAGVQSSQDWPNASTLIPTVGTFLVILAGSQLGPNLGLVISSRPLQITGDMSYSIYLWHFPLISLSSSIFGPSPTVILSAVLSSFVVAGASYTFVENPLRKLGENPRNGQFTAPLRLPPPRRSGIVNQSRKGFGIVTVLALVPTSLSLAFFMSAEEFEKKLGSPLDLPVGYQLGCHGPNLNPDLTLPVCVLPPPSSEVSLSNTPKNVYLVGDSHAAHHTEGLAEASARLGHNLELITASSCPIQFFRFDSAGKASQILQEAGRKDSQCRRWQSAAMGYLSQASSGVVIISGSSEYWLDETPYNFDNFTYQLSKEERVELYRESLFATITMLESVGHDVIVVEDVPHFSRGSKWSLASCTRMELEVGCLAVQTVDFYRDSTRNLSEANRTLSEMTDATLIDFTAELCPNEICQTASQNGIVHQHGSWEYIYRDWGHITNAFSLSLASKWESILAGAFR